MIRSVVALLIAPLCVPLTVASHDLLLAFEHRDNPNIRYLTVFPLIVAAISYGSTLLLGVPMLVLLRWLGFSGWWTAGVIGFFIGAVLWAGAAIWYLIAHGGVDISHLARQVAILGLSYFFSLPSGALGAAVGVTFWLMRDLTTGANAPILLHDLRTAARSAHKERPRASRGLL